MTKEQLAEANHLVEEIEALRPRLAELGAEIHRYKVRRHDWTKCILCIMLAACGAGMVGALRRDSILSLICIGLCIVAFGLVIFLLKTGKNYDREILDKKGVMKLHQALGRIQQNLVKHDEMMVKTQSLIQQFEKLRPVVEVELLGLMELIIYIDHCEYAVKIPEYCGKSCESIFVVSRKRYEDLVLEIIDLRECKAKDDQKNEERQRRIRQFEAELATQNSDLIPQKGP